MSVLLCEFSGFVVRKTILCEGKWGERPLPLLAQCRISVSGIEGSVNQDSVFLNSVSGESSECELSSEVSETGARFLHVATGDADCDVDRALERALCSMLVQERSTISLESSECTLQCCLELLDLRNPAPLPDWPPPLAQEVTAKYKERGVELFRQGRMVDAFHRFSKALTVLTLTEMEEPALYAVICSNLAACQLQQHNYEYARELCEFALRVKPQHAKALYRRAVAQLNLKNYKEAEQDARAVLEIEPKNSQTVQLLNQIRTETEGAFSDYQKIVHRMFNN